MPPEEDEFAGQMVRGGENAEVAGIAGWDLAVGDSVHVDTRSGSRYHLTRIHFDPPILEVRGKAKAGTRKVLYHVILRDVIAVGRSLRAWHCDRPDHVLVTTPVTRILVVPKGPG